MSAKAPAKPVHLVADHREAASGLIRALQALPDTQVEIAALTYGDFQLTPSLVVERKSANDFHQSVIDRRLFQQVEARRAAGVRTIVLVDGDPYRVRRLPPAALTGALSYLAVIEGIPVLQVPGDVATTAVMLRTLARHATQGLGYDINLAPPKPKTVREQQLHLVQAIPGIGAAKAEALLARFGSAAGVMQAAASQIAELPGFGAKTAAAIRQLLDQPFQSDSDTA